MKRYSFTIWAEHDSALGAFVADITASSPGRALDMVLDRYRVPVSAVIGWHTAPTPIGESK